MKRLALLLASLLLASVSSPAAAKDQLHLYNWNNYIAPETVKRFEDFCKCEVVQTYYSDNEELLAKLAAGARGYDILVPTSNVIQPLIKGGQLKPVDKAQLPNLKNIDPAYLNTPFDPGNKYSVPYAMSLTVIGYNDQKIKELGLPTDTWAVVFEPKYLEKIKGRVTVLDSSSELFAAALKYLGYSANDVDEAHWKQNEANRIKAEANSWQAHADFLEAHKHDRPRSSPRLFFRSGKAYGNTYAWPPGGGATPAPAPGQAAPAGKQPAAVGK